MKLLTKNIDNELYISTAMQDKMKGIQALNSYPPYIQFCIDQREIIGTPCNRCYGFGTENYPNNKKRYIQNYNLLSNSVLPYYKIPYINALFFRLDAIGEIANSNYAKNLDNFICKNSQTQFSIWTKRPELIKRFRYNCIYIYSSKYINRPEALPKSFNKVFTVYSKDYLKENKKIYINCGGKKCMDCQKCYNKRNKTVYINEILK
ncbi:MAG TPA: hypothetical protein DC057_16240 [Spirochaetia bacterium]|nr:hypothetical protein [Spirochaetia bacterium]